MSDLDNQFHEVLGSKLRDLKWPELLTGLGKLGLGSSTRQSLESFHIRSTGVIYLSCVFHEERTPSMVLREPDSYVCYGCLSCGGKSDFIGRIVAGANPNEELPTNASFDNDFSEVSKDLVTLVNINPHQGQLF